MNFLADMLTEPSKKLETSLLLTVQEVVLLPEMTIPILIERPNSIGFVHSIMDSPQKQLTIVTLKPETTKRLLNDENTEVTMVTAVASLLTGKSVRVDTAMTGEINLSGEVLPIGGVKEKVLAAHRVGIKRILLAQQNAKDLVDIPEDIRDQWDFVFCERIDQILDNALVG